MKLLELLLIDVSAAETSTNVMVSPKKTSNGLEVSVLWQTVREDPRCSPDYRQIVKVIWTVKIELCLEGKDLRGIQY